MLMVFFVLLHCPKTGGTLFKSLPTLAPQGVSNKKPKSQRFNFCQGFISNAGHRSKAKTIKKTYFFFFQHFNF